MANHYNEDAIYWGPARLSGWRRGVYNLITLGRTRNRFFGQVEGHASFWGDVCRERIRYCRNFVYADINTVRMNPWMPYADPLRPYVRYWYSASEGHKAPAFLRTLQDANQDRLEADGGGCIMYTHFGHGYVQDGKLAPEFRRTMERLAAKNGWFVPVTELLDFLAKTKGVTMLTDDVRRRMESRWLWEKAFSRHVVTTSLHHGPAIRSFWRTASPRCVGLQSAHAGGRCGERLPAANRDGGGSYGSLMVRFSGLVTWCSTASMSAAECWRWRNLVG